MVSGLPFDDYRNLLKSMRAPDEEAAAQARRRNEALRAGGLDLGAAGGHAEWLAAWSGKRPLVGRGLVAIFIGTHRGAGDGLSRLSEGYEARFVEHAAAGGAPVSQICGAQDLGLRLFDLALDLPVDDIRIAPALDERGCAATMAFGMEAIAGGTDLMALAAFGVGGEPGAAAILSVLLGNGPKAFLDPAEGALAARQAQAAQDAIDLHGPALSDPLEALRRLGGREVAASAGAMLAARVERVPVVVEGIAALAAAAVLEAAAPGAAAHCRVAIGDPVSAATAAAIGLDGIATAVPAAGQGAAAAMALVALRDIAALHVHSVPLPTG